MSISIHKSDDEPTKITVKRDGETWEVTEDNLDELPEDVRGHVKQMLSNGVNPLQGQTSFGPGSEKFEQMMRRMERFQRDFMEDNPFDSLKRDIDSLRDDLKDLRIEESGDDLRIEGGTDV